MVRIGINGFGRIGRMVLRSILQRGWPVEVVMVNDLTPVDSLAYLLVHDSVHGRLQAPVEAHEGVLRVDGREIRVVQEKDPARIPWREAGVDVVIESTGRFRTRELAALHLQAGAKRVLLSAPSKGGVDLTIVKGVNEHLYDPEKHYIVSNASCTTNSIAPVVKVLEDNYGVDQVFFSTVHSYTADQRIVDGPHHDPRRGRAAAVNIVPTTSGAAQSVVEVLPHLQGRVHGHAIRVPTPDGSLSDITAVLKRDVTREEVNELLRNVSQYHLKGVVAYREDPLVSTDILGDPHSAIIDASMTIAEGRIVKIFSWYDNEYGYSNRLVDVILHMAAKGV